MPSQKKCSAGVLFGLQRACPRLLVTCGATLAKRSRNKKGKNRTTTEGRILSAHTIPRVCVESVSWS